METRMILAEVVTYITCGGVVGFLAGLAYSTYLSIKHLRDHRRRGGE